MSNHKPFRTAAFCRFNARGNEVTGTASEGIEWCASILYPAPPPCRIYPVPPPCPFSPHTAHRTPPISQLNILRSVEENPTSNLAPAGLGGMLSLALRVSAAAEGTGKGPSLRAGSFRVAEGRSDVERRVGRKHCVVMDGVFSYLPDSGGSGQARVIGSTENRSTSLAGYVVRKEAPTRFSLTGSRGEATALLLTAESAEECDRWCKVLALHVEFVDSAAGSRWLF